MQQLPDADSALFALERQIQWLTSPIPPRTLHLLRHAPGVGRRRQPLSAELSELDARLRVLALGQGGVVNAAQVHEYGGGDAEIRRLIGAGGWRRVRRGVYADCRSDSAGGHLRRCAAVLAGLRCGEAVVSHLSAARLLGLPLPPLVDSRVALTRRPPAPTRGPRPAGGIVPQVHLCDYDDADVLVVAGVPVLAGARLVLDCCTVTAPDSALAIADAALAKGVTDRDALLAECARRRARPEMRRARLVVARADPRPENWFESISRWWLLEAGLPVPELQVSFGAHRVDLWWDAWRTVGEADGKGKYDEPGALFEEKLREDRLRDAYGVEVVRWVPAEMRSPAGRRGVAERVQRAFRRARRAS